MHPVAAKNEIMGRRPAMQHHLAWQGIKNLLHQRARKLNRPCGVTLSTSSAHQINDRWRRLGDACFLKDRQRRLVNLRKITVGKQPYLTTDSRQLRRRCRRCRCLGARRPCR